MNPYAYTAEQIPPYEKQSLGELMVSGALAVLILCLAFCALSVAIAVFVELFTILEILTRLSP